MRSDNLNFKQLKQYLIKNKYKIPQINYSFLNKIVISKDNVDICITGKLYYDQYNMYMKLVKKYENNK